MKSSRRQFILVLLMLVFLLIWSGPGCGSKKVAPANEVGTRQVTDDLGRKITLPAKVDRAISLAPSLTEMVFAVGAGDRLVGVTTYCDYPEDAKKIQKVGDTLSPNIETIVALKPQVVLVSTASQLEMFSKTLAENGIEVFDTNPQDLDSIYRNLEQLGDIFGTSETAAKAVYDLKNRIALTAEKVGDVEPVRVFVQISKEPLFTVGKRAFVTEIIKRAGGESVTANIETAYPNLSKETALALEPDAIILSESPDNLEPNDVFKNSPAVRNGKVFRVNADLLSRPGPRLVDALEQIARDLHPERFK
jgi:iron complex transport system substrate-binding protein